MLRSACVCAGSLVLLVCACTNGLSTQQNPFLTLSETFGISTSAQDDDTNAAQGSSAETTFRLPLAVTLTNNHSYADVDTAFIAWVEVGNVRSTEQEDALFRGGYVQLTEEVEIGAAYVLPIGTFVYNGGGRAGATTVQLGSPGNSARSSTRQYSLITPDAFVLFSQPPTSCDSVAFAFTLDGEALTAVPVSGAEGPFGGSSTSGGFKTLAQVNLYQCSPLHPGLFLRVGGSTSTDNEYLEGGLILINFNEAPDDNGDFAIITIS